MANEIKYPNQTTWFICYNANRVDVMAYGKVEPTQQMETGQPILDTYLIESDWIAVLKDRDITPTEES